MFGVHGLLFREGWEKVRVGGIEGVGAVGAVGSHAHEATSSRTGDAVGSGSTGSYAVPLPGAKDGSAVEPGAVDEIVDGLNQALKAADKRLQFLVHETTGCIYVKVINQETEEVIREIPPEKILDLVGHIHELVGLLVDEKV